MGIHLFKVNSSLARTWRKGFNERESDWHDGVLVCGRLTFIKASLGPLLFLSSW